MKKENEDFINLFVTEIYRQGKEGKVYTYYQTKLKDLDPDVYEEVTDRLAKLDAKIKEMEKDPSFVASRKLSIDQVPEELKEQATKEYNLRYYQEALQEEERKEKGQL